MGKMVKVACASCKREWQCMTGCGLSHALLQNVAQEFPEETGKKMMEEAAGEEFPAFEFGYCISVCGGCGNIVSVPVMRRGESGREYTGPCPVCGDGVSLIADIGGVSCPVCGNRTLTAEETGRWD